MGTLSVCPSTWNFLSPTEARTWATSVIACLPSWDSRADPEAKRTSVASCTTIRPSTIFTWSLPVSISGLNRSMRLRNSATRASAWRLRASSSERACCMSFTEALSRERSLTMDASWFWSPCLSALREATWSSIFCLRSAMRPSRSLTCASEVASAFLSFAISASRWSICPCIAWVVSSRCFCRASYFPDETQPASARAKAAQHRTERFMVSPPLRVGPPGAAAEVSLIGPAAPRGQPGWRRASSAMCAGEVPQQLPTRVAPAAIQVSARLA